MLSIQKEDEEDRSMAAHISEAYEKNRDDERHRSISNLFIPLGYDDRRTPVRG